MPITKQKEKKPSTVNATIKKYTARYFKIIPPVILVFILILGYFSLLKPKYNSIIREVDQENQKRSEQFTAEERYKDNLISLQRTYRGINVNDLARLNKMLPDKPEIENIMVMLENITNKQYVKLNSVTFNKDESDSESNPVTLGQENDKVKEIHFNMDVGSIDYRGLKKLLLVLENNLRLFDINSLDFSPDGNNLKLDITAYYWES